MDIVNRLRKPVMLHSNAEQTNAERREAADEIVRLRAALGAIIDLDHHNHGPESRATTIARAAYAGESTTGTK